MATWLPLILALGCTPREPAVQVVEHALPSVVLLVNDRPDGTTTWGSGLVVSDDGLVLTSLHVVRETESLRAMLHAPGRTSYTPMDGGLERFLFENEAAMLPAVLVRSDVALDLAVIQVDADTRAHHTVRARQEEIRVGERVYALGHPQESVWAFSSGMVSAVHSGAIQHDAAVNPGSSGGPLVDAEGQLVGIHTAEALEAAEGVAFARAAPLAMRVVDEAEESLQIDLSTPEQAALSCLRAQELASTAVLQCLHWDHRWQVLRGAAEDLDRDGPFPRGAVLHAVERAGGRAFWVGRMQEDLLAFMRPETEPAWDERAMTWELPEAVARRAGAVPEELAGARDEARRDLVLRSQAISARMREGNNLRTDASSGVTVQELLKSGVRVERLHSAAEGRVWVELVGLNPDGTAFRWSELYALEGPAWRGIDPPLAADLAGLPGEWPPPMSDLELSRAKGRAFLLNWVAWRAATPAERAEASG